MKRIVRSQKGVALLTTLMLMVLGFGVVATLLYMVTHSVKTTGLEQEYATALDAAKGGADLVINMLQNELYSPPNVGGAVGSSTLCMEQKLSMSTSDSNPCNNWPCPPCTASSTSADPKIGTDVTLTLANHLVYAKIINTKVTGTHLIYTVNVRAEALSNPGRADISFVYKLSLN